jgi:starvation-inducible DNA-binding protein
MKINIGISEKNITAVTDILEVVLSNQMMLYVKTRKAHWNVSGESFMELHKLYESQYKQLEVDIDEVAERIGKLGKHTIGTMSEFSKLSIIKENVKIYPSSKETIKELLKDHESLIVSLRKDAEECNSKHKDAGTNDFLVGLMQNHESIAWVLRRYLND